MLFIGGERLKTDELRLKRGGVNRLWALGETDKLMRRRLISLCSSGGVWTPATCQHPPGAESQGPIVYSHTRTTITRALTRLF